MSTKHDPWRIHKKRPNWWEQQRDEARAVLRDIDTPGTLAWAKARGPDFVERAKKKFPHWFGQAQSKTEPTADALIEKLEMLGLGWSIGHAGKKVEVKIWEASTVIALYVPKEKQPLALLLNRAMAEVDWKKYTPKK